MTLMLGIFDGPSGPLLLDATARGARGIRASTNVHGFERLTATVPLALEDAVMIWAWSQLPWVRLRDNTQIIWEGRLASPELFVEDETGLVLEAYGGWDMLDDPYTALWSTTQVKDFKETTEQEIANRSLKMYTTDQNNRLFIGLSKGTTYGNVANVGEYGMSIPAASGRLVLNVAFDYTITFPANWLCRLQLLDPEFLSSVVPWSLAATGGVMTGSVCVDVASTPRARVFFQCYNNTGGNYTWAGEDGAAYVRYENIRVMTQALLVNTTLASGAAFGATTISVVSAANIAIGQLLYIVNGPNPEKVTVTNVAGTTITFTPSLANVKSAGDPVRVQRLIASDIAAHIAASLFALNPTQFSDSTALLNPDGATLPDLMDQVFYDADMADALTGLALIGDSAGTRLDVAVWDAQRLLLARRGWNTRRWAVDAARVRLQRTLDTMYNRMYAVYQDASGRRITSTSASDTSSISRFGLVRRQAIPVSTTNLAEAERVRDTALADSAAPQPAARAEITRLSDLGGADHPPYLLRAGDVITVRAVPSGFGTAADQLRTLRVTRTEYDADSDTMTFEPEIPLPTLELMLARQEAGL